MVNNISYRDIPGTISNTKAKELIGISYLGGVSTSHKLDLSEKSGTLTYGLYLAPWKLSGHQVCAGGRHCHEFCLNGSGQNKIDILARGDMSKINVSRIKKTRLFYQNRPLFMRILVNEIRKAQNRARSLNMPFSVRLNCTSDLSPELFIDPETGLNILQLFSDVQFYDYTKVPNRINLLGKYPNYDLTFSYDGYNWKTAESFLNSGGRVAVVFMRQDKLPESFADYPVIDGNTYDMRYLDPGRCIVGLYYHSVGNNYKVVDGVRTYVGPKNDFVIYPDNKLVKYA